MDSRIIVLVMALTTFIAYPLLSDGDRKQVAPLATHMDEPEDEPEPEDDEDPVMMEDEDDEVADLQLDTENQYIRGTALDSPSGQEKQQIKNSASDPQISSEEDEESY
ncbi:MAG TPA: hypothetical protein VIJ14_03560 [Rhabdochlamydiaceae bacterium]